MTKKQDWVDLSHHYSNPNIRSIFSYKSFPAEGIGGRKDLARQTGFDPDLLINPKQSHSTNVSFFTNPGGYWIRMAFLLRIQGWCVRSR